MVINYNNIQIGSLHLYILSLIGISLLKYNTCEHNLVSISKVYSSVKIDELDRLLYIEPSVAEKIAAKMILENRLEGTIDGGVIFFQRKLFT